MIPLTDDLSAQEIEDRFQAALEQLRRSPTRALDVYGQRPNPTGTHICHLDGFR